MKTDLPKISVIVPVHNVEDYLEKCITSIVCQTYTNLEIILVDDGSTDHSPQICDAWAMRDTRIKVIHQENAGAAAARNNALQLAVGEYIGFVDSDDWIADTMYHDMMEGIKETGAEAAFVGYVRILENGESKRHKYKKSGLCTREEALTSAIAGGYFVTIWNKLFSRKICVKDGNLFMFEPYICGEDEHWLVRVLININKAYLLDRDEYFWRVRNGSITYKRDAYEVRRDVYRVKRENCKLLKTVSEQVYKTAVVDQYINMYSTFVNAYVNKDDCLCRLMKEHISKYKKIYLTSNESIISKCKKLFVEIMMRLHFPIAMIKFFDSLGS